MKYKDCGVDIDAESQGIASMIPLLQKTFQYRKNKHGEVASDIGHYANLIKFNDHYLVLSTDGVGTKVLIAQKAGKYKTIPIDMVAMCVNDILCLGAEPISLVDYLAVSHIDNGILTEIADGLANAAEMAEISIVGGETASVKDLLNQKEDFAFDLAGCALGVVHPDHLIDGTKIEEGQYVIGIASSGIHSNGLSLARKALLSKYNLDEILPWGKTVENELLEPTLIYVKPVLKSLEQERENITGLAHITGSGLKNLFRLKKGIGYVLDSFPPPPPIFAKIKQCGNVPLIDMFETFNMGIGFCIICKNPEPIVDIINKEGFNASVIGKTVSGNTVELPYEGVSLC